MIIDRISRFPIYIKTSLIIVSLILGYFGWYALSPLIFKGETGKEDLDLSSGTVILSGEFEHIDKFHYGSGSVLVFKDEQGNLELKFVNVEISNGPDLYIYLSNKESFSGTNDDDGNSYDLGKLLYTSGNFSRLIPTDVDIIEYNSVLIWCKRASVVFTWAALS